MGILDMLSKKSDGMRGQAAMEYLMTYGWAILVIVIVLAVLLYFLPQFLRAPESCIFGQAGFTCSDQRPSIYLPANGNEVHLAINVFNGQGKTINVKQIRCTTAPVSNVQSGESVPPGVSASIPASGTKTYDTVCLDTNGNPVQLSQGSDFRGSFILWYNFQDDVKQDVQRQAVATVSGSVLQQSPAPQ